VQTLQAQGLAPAEIGTHAGLADTSLMLALDPRLVRMEKLTTAPAPDAADGVNGDPARSSAKLGMPGVELIVTRTVAAIRKAVAKR